MGRFGIQFSDENNKAFKISERKQYLTIGGSNNPYDDSKLDKAMAWLSYYALVFCAICVFNQPAAAFAVELVTDDITQIIGVDKVEAFQLRETH